MFDKVKKYDYRVQIMRIIASFIVIGCHVRTLPVYDGVVDKLSLFLYGFYNDGVAIFFMIMGFFLFAVKEPFWKSIGKTFLSILIPVFILRVFLMWTSDISAASLDSFATLLHPNMHWKELFTQFVTMNIERGEYCEHLWYIEIYLQVIVLFPLLKLLTLDNKASKHACVWVVAINVLAMLLTDIQVFIPAMQGLWIFSTFQVAATYAVVGYIIYKYREKIKNTWVIRVISFSVMVLANIIRYFLQYNLFKIRFDDYYFAYWNTIPGLMFAISFIVFFLSLAPYNKDSNTNDNKTTGANGFEKFRMVINYIGARTFVIYLIHWRVFTILDRAHVREKLIAPLEKNHGLFNLLFYNVLYPLIVFIVSLIIAIIVDAIKNVIICAVRAIPFRGRSK